MLGICDNGNIYFDLETTGITGIFMDLCNHEQIKIYYSKRHLEALEEDVRLQVAISWPEIKVLI